MGLNLKHDQCEYGRTVRTIVLSHLFVRLFVSVKKVSTSIARLLPTNY